MTDALFGRIVILNGSPRAGKSSIAAVIQDSFDGVWMNLGVDVFARDATPPRLRPGVGLRPGGERPDLEPFVRAAYAAMFDSMAAHSRQGLNVVADVGLHDDYSRPLGVLRDAARRLVDLPVLFVGVRCAIREIMRRRNAGQEGRETDYARGAPDDPPAPVLRWERAVHDPGLYDLEVDTTVTSPADCAALIRARLGRSGQEQSVFARLAEDRAPR